MKNYTDINQSDTLAKYLPFESADMCYAIPYEEGDRPLLEQGGFGSTPCWSLASLLATLPNEIITDNRFECHYQIDIRKYDWYDNATLYQIAYGNNRGLSGSWHDMVNTGEKKPY